MLRSVLLIAVAFTLIFSLPIGQRLIASTEARMALHAQVNKILADGDANDDIPVIISLDNPVFARSEFSLDPQARQQRIDSVRALQNDFVTRQAALVRVMPRQPQLHPIVFAKMRRQDVAAIAADSAVVSIKQDKPLPVLMNLSTALIGSAAANASGYDGTGMTVAVLDTGVKTNHEFLDGQVVAEACFSNYWTSPGEVSLCPSGASTDPTVTNDTGSAAPCSYAGMGCDHGTHVAGTVAGKEITVASKSMRGVAPGAKIIGIQVFTYYPDTDPTATDNSGIGSYSADQMLAMDWLMTNMSTPSWGTLAALNMSLGGGESATTCDVDEAALKAYIDDLRTLKVATIIASGNEEFVDKIASPACISSAIAVGATTTESAVGYGATAADQVASFSNAPTSANNGMNANGDRLLDLLAPGMWIYSSKTASTTDYGYKQGTSMATPHVAGAWAVMKQIAPDASVGQILQWLFATGTTITDTRNGLQLPRINVDDAVALSIVEMTTTPTASKTSTATRTATRTFTRTFTRTRTRTPTPVRKPLAFNKTAPVNNAVNQALSIKLSWAASTGATSYEYCFALTAAGCTNWKSVGTARTVTVPNLAKNKAFYWNVRAKNVAGFTVSNNGTVWKFTTRR